MVSSSTGGGGWGFLPGAVQVHGACITLFFRQYQVAGMTLVHSLQAGKQSGVGAWKVSQRVAPLFETLADLNNAGKVMRRLFSVRWYREQLRSTHPSLTASSPGLPCCSSSCPLLSSP